MPTLLTDPKREYRNLERTSIKLDKPLKYELQTMALKNNTTLMYLLNVAAEEWLKKIQADKE